MPDAQPSPREDEAERRVMQGEREMGGDTEAGRERLERAVKRAVHIAALKAQAERGERLAGSIDAAVEAAMRGAGTPPNLLRSEWDLINAILAAKAEREKA